MKLINTREGGEVRIGDVVDGFRLVKVKSGLLSALVLMERVETGAQYWVPITVRFLHPDFMFQRVGFLPS